MLGHRLQPTWPPEQWSQGTSTSPELMPPLTPNRHLTRHPLATLTLLGPARPPRLGWTYGAQLQPMPPRTTRTKAPRNRDSRLAHGPPPPGPGGPGPALPPRETRRRESRNLQSLPRGKLSVALLLPAAPASTRISSYSSTTVRRDHQLGSFSQRCHAP